jgi:hypothetical protein
MRVGQRLVPAGKGALFDDMLITMRRVWDSKVTGASGPIPPLPAGRPSVLLPRSPDLEQVRRLAEVLDATAVAS